MLKDHFKIYLCLKTESCSVLENNIPGFLVTRFEGDLLFFHRNPRGGASDIGKSWLLPEHHCWCGSYCSGDCQCGDVFCPHDPGLRPDSSTGQNLRVGGMVETQFVEMLWSSCSSIGGSSKNEVFFHLRD